MLSAFSTMPSELLINADSVGHPGPSKTLLVQRCKARGPMISNMRACSAISRGIRSVMHSHRRYYPD